MATFVGTAGTDPGDDLKVGNHKVGIGTTSFLSPLDFSQDLGNKILLYPHDTDNSAGFGIQAGLLQMFAGYAWDIGFGYGASGNFNELMRIKSSGNVGIGSTSPSCALDVVGTAKASTAVITPAIKPATDSTTAVQVQKSDGTTVVNVDTTNGRVGIGTTSISSENPDMLYLANATADMSTIIALENYMANSMTSGYIIFRKSNSNTKGTRTTTVNGQILSLLFTYGVGAQNEWGPASEILSIQDGTVTPETGFYVPARIEFRVTDGTNNLVAAMAIKPSGRIGIGNTTPGAQLEVTPTITDTSDYKGIKSGLVVNGDGMTNCYLHYIATPTNGDRITNKYALVSESGAGAVGIGTTSPSERLDVNGNIKASGSVQVGNNSDGASASNVGAIRYRTSGNNSYVDICMQYGSGLYRWENIKTLSW